MLSLRGLRNNKHASPNERKKNNEPIYKTTSWIQCCQSAACISVLCFIFLAKRRTVVRGSVNGCALRRLEMKRGTCRFKNQVSCCTAEEAGDFPLKLILKRTHTLTYPLIETKASHTTHTLSHKNIISMQLFHSAAITAHTPIYLQREHQQQQTSQNK